MTPTTMLRVLVDAPAWGDDDHVPAPLCPWRPGHLPAVVSYRPRLRPWRRIYQVRCWSCDLVVSEP